MNSWEIAIITIFTVLFMCAGIFFALEEKRERKFAEESTREYYEKINALKMALYEQKTKAKKEIEELTQSVSEQINDNYREYDISVKWEYGNSLDEYFYCPEHRINYEPPIRLIIQHNHFLKKMELIYTVYYIVDLIAEKKRIGAFVELFKDITEHINEYKNEIEGENLIELINNE